MWAARTVEKATRPSPREVERLDKPRLKNNEDGVLGVNRLVISIAAATGPVGRGVLRRDVGAGVTFNEVGSNANTVGMVLFCDAADGEAEGMRVLEDTRSDGAPL